MALQTFEQFGMIEIVDGVITIPNWGKHQNLDQLESKKEYMRGYMKDYREKQKALTSGKTNCKTNCKTNVSQADIEEEDKDKEKEKNVIGQKRKRFVPPTLDEVRAYCQERKNNVDPKKFYDYFTASDWHDSKGKKVQSWKQKVITWEGYHNKTTGANGIPISNASSDLDDIF